MKYFHRIIDEERADLERTRTTAHAAVIKGERITAGLIEKKKGSGSRPHRHALRRSEQISQIGRPNLVPISSIRE